jgi:Flp pilus assembly protein TadG
VSNPKPGPSRRRSGRGRGQALTEFALVIPIFMLVLSGILDFGFLLYSRMTVISTAREGARAVISLVGTTTTTSIPSTAQARVVGAATGTGLVLATSDVAVSCVVTPGSTTTSPCTFTTHTPRLANDVQAGDAVSVRVTYVYHSFFPLLFGSTFNLVSTVQMVFE